MLSNIINIWYSDIIMLILLQFSWIFAAKQMNDFIGYKSTALHNEQIYNTIQ